MILQALYEYYRRKATDPDTALAPEGFEMKEIPFVIVLNKAGEFIQLEDTRHGDGRQKRAKRFLVPKDCNRANVIKANLLWDKPDYFLGYCPPDTPAKDADKIAKRHQAFQDEIQATFPQDTDDAGLLAVRQFLAKQNFEDIYHHPVWQEVLNSTGPVLSFKLLGDGELVCERSGVYRLIADKTDDDMQHQGICLITGEDETIARLHPKIKGVLGAQTSGANLVSFNADAFVSYGKQSALNSPVSKTAAFAYGTALNHLLGKDSRQKLQLGDTTVVFWSEKQTDMEDLLSVLLSGFEGEARDNPDAGAEALNALYSSPWKGRLLDTQSETRFYVLGLSPNAARLSVRFWEVTTVAQLATNLRQHFEDLKLTHGDKYNGYLPVARLLQSIAVQEKRENIPPNLEGATLKAILTGTPYPATLLMAALQRSRADQERHASNRYMRAALIKACLNRQHRFYGNAEEKELTMALDETNTNPGYCLGRLFAVLEKAQEDASGGTINATIADRFYGAASSRPLIAFTPLMRLNRHHLAKIENPAWVGMHKKRITEIMSHLEGGFPRQLSLEEQGRFAVGYYHQRQAFFTKAEDKPVSDKVLASVE
jgi:CRISPR-associated protein Csd1